MLMWNSVFPFPKGAERSLLACAITPGSGMPRDRSRAGGGVLAGSAGQWSACAWAGGVLVWCGGVWCNAVVHSEQGAAWQPWPWEDAADNPTTDEAFRSLSLALDLREVLHPLCSASPCYAPLHLFYLIEREPFGFCMRCTYVFSHCYMELAHLVPLFPCGTISH